MSTCPKTVTTDRPTLHGSSKRRRSPSPTRSRSRKRTISGGNKRAPQTHSRTSTRDLDLNTTIQRALRHQKKMANRVSADQDEDGISPLTPFELLDIRRYLVDRNNLCDLQLYVMTLIAIRLALRDDELVALRVDSINWSPCTIRDNGEIINLAFTVQSASDPKPVTLLLHTDDTVPEFCAVRHLLCWIHLTGIKSGYLFPDFSVLRSLLETGGSHVSAPMSALMYAEHLRNVCNEVITKYPRNFGSYTNRKTFYLWGVWGGASLETLMRDSRHQTRQNALVYVKDADVLLYLARISGRFTERPMSPHRPIYCESYLVVKFVYGPCWRSLDSLADNFVENLCKTPRFSRNHRGAITVLQAALNFDITRTPIDEIQTIASELNPVSQTRLLQLLDQLPGSARVTRINSVVNTNGVSIGSRAPMATTTQATYSTHSTPAIPPAAIPPQEPPASSTQVFQLSTNVNHMHPQKNTSTAPPAPSTQPNVRKRGGSNDLEGRKMVRVLKSTAEKIALMSELQKKFRQTSELTEGARKWVGDSYRVTQVTPSHKNDGNIDLAVAALSLQKLFGNCKGTDTDAFAKVWDDEAAKQLDRAHSKGSGQKQEEITVEVVSEPWDQSGQQEAFSVLGVRGLLRPSDVLEKLPRKPTSTTLLSLIDSSTLWDLNRPLQSSCTLRFLNAGSTSPTSPSTENSNDQSPALPPPLTDERALNTLWHSGSHLLGYALESHFGDDCLLTDGPALQEGGFFYDSLLKKSGSERVEKILELLEKHQDKPLESVLDSKAMIKDLLTTQADQIYSVQSEDVQQLTKLVKSIVSKKVPFERMEVDRSTALRMFAFNPFKLHFISRVPADQPVTLYKCGDFIDLCRGPHIVHSGQAQAVKLLKTAGAQWDTHSTEDTTQHLSRVYGIAFPSKEHQFLWEKAQAEARKRDHRVIGKKQSLFTFSNLSPGSVFMLPHGTRIANKLMDTLRKEYRTFGYQEVVTPLIFNKELWETSGHWQHYKDDMFVVAGGAAELAEVKKEGGEEAGEQLNGLKPMNCPGHCLLFDSSAHSYRDLPVRIAEFSPLHRNEASGALAGLTRLRKFHQDDAHIFCTPEQVSDEIFSTLQMIDRLYRIFRFPSYELALSTRPKTGYIGAVAEWDEAEHQLRHALEQHMSTSHPISTGTTQTSKEITIREGDGAFYGPKIDVLIRDAQHRRHQLGTIQLDFQLPRRFNLRYQSESGGFQHPVLIHRAALGSVERMMAILCEHFGGKWPFWLSPRQACVVPVSAEHIPYAEQVWRELSGIGWRPNTITAPSTFYHVDVDRRDVTLPKKIRDAQTLQYNFILVVGAAEREAGTVSVRAARDAGGKQVGTMTVGEVREMFEGLEKRFE
ncbi:54S ribosomal protein L39, mitochondrial [Quaeritorhiza haematococci]|nr:54S ribosomal protein L39, mitochondrial [Quaeritorhiza haematococci]